jgi:hypothetical protein
MQNFGGKPFAKCSLERPRTEEYNNPMDPRKTSYDG